MRLLAVLVIAFVCVPSVFSQKKSSKRTNTPKPTVVDTISIDNSLIKAPVALFGDTLFYVYGNIGSITADARAEAIEENIKKLVKDPFFDADSLKISIETHNHLITYIEDPIMGVNDIQAEVLGKSKSELAHEYLDIITQAVLKEKDRTSLQGILKLIGIALLILASTFFAIKYLNVGYRKLKAFIATRTSWTIDKLSFLLDTNKQLGILLFLLKAIRLSAILFILYFCLYAFLGLFPETQWLSQTLIGYIISPLRKAYHAVVDFIPDLFTIFVIFFLFKYFIKAVKIVIERIADGSIYIRGFYADWAEPTFHIIKVLLYAFMIVLIFPHLPGNDTKAFQGVSVFLGIIFSLGSTSVIANVVSGIVITYMRPFKLGDRIKMGEFSGNVIEKTPLVTRIKTPKNEIITIPNGTIMNAQTINYSNSADEYGLILYAAIRIGYDVPWRKAHELLIEAGLNTPDVLKEPKPFVLQAALDDFYVEYQINIYTKEANKMAAIYSDLNKNIQDIFEREGLELLSPHFVTAPLETKPAKTEDFVKTGFDRFAPFNMKPTVSKGEEDK